MDSKQTHLQEGFCVSRNSEVAQMKRDVKLGGPPLILLLQDKEDKWSGGSGTHAPSHRTEQGSENARVSRTAHPQTGALAQASMPST